MVELLTGVIQRMSSRVAIAFVLTIYVLSTNGATQPWHYILVFSIYAVIYLLNKVYGSEALEEEPENGGV